MRSSASLLPLLLSSTLPVAAFACAHSMSYVGRAEFAADGSVVALAAAADDDYEWLRLGLDGERTELGRWRNVPRTWESTQYRVRVAGARSLALVSGLLVEPAAGEVRQIREGIAAFDAVESPGGVTVVATTQGELPELLVLELGIADELVERARAPLPAGVDPVLLVVQLSGSGTVEGLVDETPFRLESEIVFEDPIVPDGAMSVAGAGDGAYFVARLHEIAGASPQTELLAARRVEGGGWNVQAVATLPVIPLHDGRLAAASPEAIAFAGADSDEMQLYAISGNGPGWDVEPVARIPMQDDLDARLGAGGLEILAAGVKLELFIRQPDGSWGSTTLARIGFTEQGGCSITGLERSAPSRATGMIALAGLAVAGVLRRRRERG